MSTTNITVTTTTIVKINLRDFYPWYDRDEFVELPEVVAAELFAGKRYESAYQRRTFYNKAHYSIDAEDGIESVALACHIDTPETAFAKMENYCRLCHALNSLSEIPGKRIEARYLQGKTVQEIAKAEGVSESAVKASIDRGLREMKKFLSKNLQNCVANCP